ncbi:AmmeMemoRadiSam system protein B [Novipirellula herctigrandis]
MQTKEIHSVDDLAFTTDELHRIHRSACRLVSAAVRQEPCDVTEMLGDLENRTVAGVFVTLRRRDTLRGCCGSIGQSGPLGKTLAEAADRAARHDPRMTPVADVELPYLKVSFSILGPPHPIDAKGEDRVGAVEIGKHGLRIRAQGFAGLLLPTVATDRGWDARQFLEAVCTKAGLAPTVWQNRDAIVETFDGIEYGAPFSEGTPRPQHESPAYGEHDLVQLAHWVKTNLTAIQSGATPHYYVASVNDRAVVGIVFQLAEENSAQMPKSFAQFSLRDGVPMQSTLYQMTQNAATALAPKVHAESTEVRLAILTAPVHHGTDVDADLDGLNCRHRALIVIQGNRWSLAYRRTANPTELLAETMKGQSFRTGAAQVYSVLCDSTEKKLAASMGPQAIDVVSVRPPAVAGSFYPADDVERESLVDELIDGFDSVEKQTVAAAMVPHAGLRFSGRVAADVWRRIEIPESVLIIGPKHTGDGMDWAVAPHNQWRISPSVSMEGNIDLAQRIAKSVSGMQLDSVAHRREHGIEVQLPLLHRIAPKTNVAAIAMGRANYEEIEAAAKQLATCLMELVNPPLLVISSDMNHFADDDETRRRDRIALDTLARLDALRLLDVCAENNISMCGQVPAALVLLTLKAMNRELHYNEINYATSADVSGDRTRVVGYAGVTF